jgi:glycosyltransferase involved in cell wall biosynthesis
VAPLVQGVAGVLRRLGRPFEIVVVDDGSRDATLSRLRELREEVPELVVLALRRNFGQTAALKAGLERARGEAIVTMDGDLQNDPEDIPRLVAALEAGADVVSGWRRQRRDTLLRKVPSWLANGLIRLLTRVPIHDQGCSLKAYRRSVVRGLDLYADLHRFVAILAMPLGARIEEIEVRHHSRTAGSSKYGLSRTTKVMLDLFEITMLTGFREHPIRWFAIVALAFLAAALAIVTMVLLGGGEGVVFTAVGFLALFSFTGCMLYGLLAETLLELVGRGRSRGVLHREWGRDQ